MFSGGRPLADFIGQNEPPRKREKPFHCTICHKRYSHETGYLKHMASHPESDPSLRNQLWSCPVCQKVFTKESYLLRHMEMKLDDEHAAELIILKKKLKIGTEKPIPPGQTSYTSSMGISRELGEGTSRDYHPQLGPGASGPHDIIRQTPTQGSGSSPHRVPNPDSTSEVAYSQLDHKPLVFNHTPQSIKFNPLHRDTLRSPAPQPISTSEYHPVGPVTGGSPHNSNTSSPDATHQLQPHQPHQHSLATQPQPHSLATPQPRTVSRSSDVFVNSQNNNENPSFAHGSDNGIPKDMSIREAPRDGMSDGGVTGPIRRSNSDSSFASHDAYSSLPLNQDNVDYGRPPSHATAFSRSPDTIYPISAAYRAHPQGGPGSFCPPMIPPSYLPPLHSPPYTPTNMGITNPYISPTASEMTEIDVASALQHLARSATSTLFTNR